MSELTKLVGLGVLLSCAGSPGHAQDPLPVLESGVFYVGGSVAQVGGVEQHTGQARVQVLVPEVRRPSGSVVMYPGRGLSSYIYLSTPDGREGWAQIFAREGYGVYLYDPVGTAPSGFALERGAELLVWEPGELWRMWGFGGERDQPYGNVRFPVAAIDQLYASLPPHLSGSDAANVDALLALLARTGPAVILAHGSAGEIAFAAARLQPDRVRAIVGLDPDTCPETSTGLAALQDIPLLVVYGDYLQSRGRTGSLQACRAATTAIDSRGARSEVLELTAERIFGNTHLLMQDDNSAEIAARVLRWINRRAD